MLEPAFRAMGAEFHALCSIGWYRFRQNRLDFCPVLGTWALNSCRSTLSGLIILGEPSTRQTPQARFDDVHRLSQRRRLKLQLLVGSSRRHSPAGARKLDPQKMYPLSFHNMFHHFFNANNSATWSETKGKSVGPP